jgi:ribosome-binding factor A
MVQHREQVASVLQRAVQAVLSRGLNDPRIKGMITVTSVKVSPDLINATVNVSIHPEESAATTMKGLHAAARHIRSQMARHVEMRRVPDLAFKLDESLKKQAEVLAALDEARRRSAELGHDIAVEVDQQKDQ